ncbi:MAG: acetate--CoA ligase family protein [Spirochaetes bacterium]|nr:acetate--CoA ligase family protein [Spirochaetota bacterium]
MPDSSMYLDHFFHPESIAVVGASENSLSYGARYIQALIDFGYKGKLYAINHNGDNILGYKIFRKLSDVPDKIDLAFVSIPAGFIADIIRECIEKDIKAAVVFTAGFSETGEHGCALEKEIMGIAAGKIRLMGPNCFGPYCPGGGITFVTGSSFSCEPGSTALIAQSGQLAECIIGRALGEGVRYSKFASYGNAIDINEADLLDFLMQDDETRIITSYMEGVKDGSRFFEIARNNSGKKPVIIWKAGLTGIGAVASSSHTGSIAGTNDAWNAFFSQTSAIKVTDLDEMTDTTAAFNCIPEGCGSRAAYVSGGGAGAVIGADACEISGMQMPAFSPETEERLRELFPGTGTSLRNPVDIGNPHPSIELLEALLELMSADENVDIIVVRRVLFSVKLSRIFSGSTAPPEEQQQTLLEVPVRIKNKYKKPVAIILSEDLTDVKSLELEKERREIRDYFFSNGIPVFLSEQRAFRALSNLARFRQRAGAGNIPAITGKDKPSEGREVFIEILKNTGSKIFNEIQSKTILKKYGINVTEPMLAKSENEALSAAEKLGYPVVMKIVSPQITHKSDIGGVKTDLQGSEQVKNAYNGIMKAVKEKAAGAFIEGVSIQKMAEPGIELVIGMTRDPQFGPMLMFGLGGTLVEVLKDVSFRIVPLSGEDAKSMIKQVKSYRLLEGYRGRPGADIENLEKMLLKFSELIKENPEIKEIDINPVIAYKDGAVAVDARIIPD